MKRKYLFIAAILIVLLALPVWGGWRWISEHKNQQESSITSALKTAFVIIPIDKNWQFKQADTNQWMPASVPGTVHTDLLRNDQIKDPFFRMNENELQWIENKDWEYQTTFTVDAQLLSKQVVELSFEGLDTYAHVFLNDHKILESDNMFVGFKVDCKQYLKEGENKLRILFESPVRRGMERLKRLDYILPATNEQAPVGERTNIFTRKAPFHYGWDWGPRLVTSGIWRAVSIHAWDKASIDNVYIVTKTASDKRADIAVDMNLLAREEGNYLITLFINGKAVVKNQKAALKPGENHVAFDFRLNNPKLWWSNGLGEPHLYHFDFHLTQNNEILHNHSLNYGVRTLELVQQPDEAGQSFHFVLNGVPVFMKGANIIPSETLTPSVSEETYRKMIRNSVDANMNMLRVWGGAIYEEDLFYRLCDENGILVWQDFMFACALQPGDEAHLENIRQEAEYNVKRLRNFACIALWCGDNENLMGWHTWGWKESFTPEVREFVWKTYETINYDILPSAVAKYDPKNAYWASSPSSINNTLPDRKSGDEHDWTIWFGQKRFSAYWEEIPRFVSEWGMQAFPPKHTYDAFTIKEDQYAASEVMHHRQRSKMEWVSPGFDGNDMIARYMEWYYKVPEDFDRFAYTSQLLQALGYKTAIEAHRSNMPHCMGSLYWQLNDCWPTISWATLDYFYRWKASHYAVRKAFEPVIVTAAMKDDMLEVYAVSDLPKARNVQLVLELMDFSGKTVFKENKRISVAPNTSERVFTINPSGWLKNSADSTRLLLNMQLVSDGKVIADNIYYFTEPKNLDLPKASPQFELKQAKDGYQITITSPTLVKNLYLETSDPDAFISDNFFDLLPSVSRTITLTGNTKTLKKEDIILTYLNQ
jgi:beta-mannosidase